MKFEDRIAEIHEFLGFVANEWPRLRPQVANQLANRCSRCILSERYVSLRDGVCEICLAGKDEATKQAESSSGDAAKSDAQLRAMLDAYSHKGTGNYDALVLFSGGKDSAYLLHRLRSEFPSLRVLALTVDNGFFSQVAAMNCNRILDRIDGVDHIVLKPDKNLFEKTFRHAFTHRSSSGCYATVDRMDGDLTFDIGRNFAATMEIPLLIAGLSPEQVTRILGLNSFESPAEVEQRTRGESAGFDLSMIYADEERTKYWWNGKRWPRDKIPRVIYPFFAWGYDEDSIRGDVTRLNLIDEGQSNPLVTNNDTIPLMLAVDVCTLGYSSFEPEFAQLVRSGKADRTAWLMTFESLNYLATSGRFLPQSIEDTLTRLRLKSSDVGLTAYQ